MANIQDKTTRKKILFWGAAVLSSLTVLKFLPGAKPKAALAEEDTVKMLGQDGKLVEISRKDLGCGNRKKITDEELKKWVNHK